MEQLLVLVMYIVIIGLVAYLLWWLIGYIGLPEPFSKVARVLVAVVAVVLLIGILFQFLPPLSGSVLRK